jgi:hypothetical protein
LVFFGVSLAGAGGGCFGDGFGGGPWSAVPSRTQLAAKVIASNEQASLDMSTLRAAFCFA